jgi:hypothetical protein
LWINKLTSNSSAIYFNSKKIRRINRVNIYFNSNKT